MDGCRPTLVHARCNAPGSSTRARPMPYPPSPGQIRPDPGPRRTATGYTGAGGRLPPALNYSARTNICTLWHACTYVRRDTADDTVRTCFSFWIYSWGTGRAGEGAVREGGGGSGQAEEPLKKRGPCKPLQSRLRATHACMQLGCSHGHTARAPARTHMRPPVCRRGRGADPFPAIPPVRSRRFPCRLAPIRPVILYAATRARAACLLSLRGSHAQQLHTHGQPPPRRHRISATLLSIDRRTFLPSRSIYSCPALSCPRLHRRSSRILLHFAEVSCILFVSSRSP